jgi:tRNA A-37 threonylcarbamoyl transferase component Bud32/dienelactone hydrolase
MIGQTVSHYRILEELGGGGMGVVYKAEDTKLKRTVALKFLSPDLTRDKDAKTRFIHEAQAASALQHNNICAIHEIDETADGRMFISMDCYEGEPLRDRVAKGPLSLEDALDIVIQVADGLAEAHGHGMVHRDIKPANIMITEKGVVKIVDFGLAKLAGQTKITKSGATVGTVLYMSPEQATGKEVDHRSDTWSLGVVLYELLTGEPPFQGEHEAALLYQIVHEEPKPVTALRPEVPDALTQIVGRALSKEPEGRYASVTELLADLKAVQRELLPPEAPAIKPVSVLRLLRQPRFLVSGVILLLALGSLSLWWRHRQAKVRWARQEALPEIERLAEDVPWTGEGPETWRAFELALEAARYIPDDPLLTRLWPCVTRYAKISSEPTGAKIYAKPYADVESVWRYFGQAPIDGVRFPKGYSRVKLEREGFRTIHDLVWSIAWYSDTLKRHYRLPEMGSLPEEMELVPAARVRPYMYGLENLDAKPVGEFLMDRYEVTNEAYKRFIDSGGYTDPKYWKYPFVEDDRTLTWEEAMKAFTDRTGRPGPATWEVGDYPNGEDDHPVSGLSWYEAAAYAEFAGKRLPTIYHWTRVASIGTIPEVIRFCNMGSDGTRPVGSARSMNRFGVYDMAGNVREWCFNETSYGGTRLILGGGWNDPAYAFTDPFAQDPFDRSETNGFRCIRDLESQENRAELEHVLEIPFRDFLKEPQVTDETFDTFLKPYAYDKTELDAVVEWVREEEEWIREKITFNAAYGGERVIAYLFLPKQGTPPYQIVIYFPGVTALRGGSSEDLAIPFLVTLAPGSRAFLPKSGRAVLYPVYKSTFDRQDDFNASSPVDGHLFADHVVMWAKDLSRSIDYLETRNDIDADKIAYFGYSWGSTLGGILAAVETRIKASVLLVAGLDALRCLPEVDPIHYLPRVTTPMLLLNGRYDFFYPYETSQIPFFELIGTRAEDKKLFLAESSHNVPRTDLIRETLAWLDRYLGPVE